MRGEVPMGKNRIGVLALDLDGTLKTKDRRVNAGVTRKLRALRSSGVRLILVTGRCELELRKVVETSLFDAIVAENGAILIQGKRKEILAPDEWCEARRSMLKFFKSGCEEVIFALDRELEEQAVRVIDPSVAKIEFNKDRLMIMPIGIDKTSGLLAALRQLGASTNDMMCVGDGENDLPMFRIARIRVALKNSVEILKDEADYVSKREDGEGVLEAIDRFVHGKYQ
ncbi:MAG: HAD hydrolase family protein [Thaumarchaeota archaeon]|nr:HAD hydrolase family protein [Nitrososphaerota archaeon]